MKATRILLLSYARTPRVSVVTSAKDFTVLKFPDLAAKKVNRFRFFILDGGWQYETYSGDPAYTVTLAIGDLRSAVVLASVATFTSISETIDGYSTSGWEMDLDLTGAEVAEFVSGQLGRECWIEFEARDGGGRIVTYCQQRITLRNSIIP